MPLPLDIQAEGHTELFIFGPLTSCVTLGIGSRLEDPWLGVIILFPEVVVGPEGHHISCLPSRWTFGRCSQSKKMGMDLLSII